jgi:hypothetical protein
LAFFGGGAFAVVDDVEVGSMSMLGAIVITQYDVDVR